MTLQGINPWIVLPHNNSKFQSNVFRNGYSADPLAKWVGERTGITVSWYNARNQAVELTRAFLSTL